MTDTVKLKELINSKGLKLKYIADRLGISAYSLQKKINNVTEFKTTEIMALCEILEITDLQEKEAIFYAKVVYCE